MAAFTLYDVLRHLTQQAAWPSEADKHAALASIAEAENMSVLGNAARNIECSHPSLTGGRCEECGRTIEVGHSIPTQQVTRQGWR